MAFDLVICLVLGGLWTTGAVCYLLSFRKIMVSGFVFGGSFITLGVLGLTGAMAPPWLGVSTRFVNGVLMIYGFVYLRSNAPSRSKWELRAFLATGVGLVAWALLSASYMIYKSA